MPRTLKNAVSCFLLIFFVYAGRAQSTPPVLTLIKPVEGAVGRPSIDVKATCVAAAGHCQITVVVVNGATNIPVGTFSDSVDTAIDVTAYEGSWNMQVQVTGTDQNNLQSAQTRDFYVEASPYLTPVYTANNPITGFLGDKLLVHNLIGQPQDSPLIVNYMTGVTTTVPFRGLIPYTGGEFISSTGVVFLGQPAAVARRPAGQQAVYDWNNGTLDSLSGLFPGYLTANGDYAAWMAGGPTGLFIRNLASGTTQLVDVGMDNATDIDTSGALAYTNNSGLSADSLLLYKNGVSTAIATQPVGTLLTGPLTDGMNVAYIRQNNPQSQYIYRYDAKTGTNTMLCSLENPLNMPKPIQGTAYRVSNGCTAYLQADANSVYQAWVRDTAGNNTQASSFSSAASIERLAPNGQLAFFIQQAPANPYGLRYIFDKTAGLTPVSSQLGTSYFQNSAWYLTIGNTLFRVNLSINPDRADSFAVNVREDSLYTYSVNDFASHYQTSGSLSSVVITKMPSHGSLKLSGAEVTINQVIPRSALATLVYTPATSFIGSDTAAWTGWNGFTSSPDTALLLFSVVTVLPTVPPAPQLSGLRTTYCINDGSPEYINITNIPGPVEGVTMSVSLDGQALVVSSPGYVSLDPWKMTAGMHTLAVIYSNAVGADTTSAAFQISVASTPLVTLTATPSTLSGTTEQVLLTATDVSGGGIAPLYTFSTDYSFSSHILQAESDSNTMTIAASALTADTTVVYVRMATSDSCFTTPIGVDSVVLINPMGSKSPPPADTSGAVPGIRSAPNPFTGILVILGLDPTKTYHISLLNSSGAVVLSQVSQGSSGSSLLTASLGQGIYYLRVVDGSSGRVVKREVLMKAD